MANTIKFKCKTIYLEEGEEKNSYRRLLLNQMKNSEKEYKQLASILKEFHFSNLKTKKEAQKLLETIRKHYKNLEEQLKSLDSSAAAADSD